MQSLSGNKYAVTFTDEYTKYAVVKFMSEKSQVLDKFKEYVAEAGTPRQLRSDNGAEYTSKQFMKFCRDSKINQEFTVPETPQQNGVAERFNRTLVEMGRCLLIQAKLPKKYWVRALSTATHIRNLTLSVNSNEGKSPFEVFSGKAPRRNHLRVFGCTAYVRKRKKSFKKLDPRSVKAKFIGYNDRSTAYVLQEFDTRKIIRARNVLFKEEEIRSVSEMNNPTETILGCPNLDFDGPDVKELGQTVNENPVEDEVGEHGEVPQGQPENDAEDAPLRREMRNRRPPERYGHPYTFTTAQEEVVEP